MTDIPTDIAPTAAARARRDIPLPDGDVLKPRRRFAEEDLGVSDRTCQRMRLPTVYVGGVAHVRVNESLSLIAGIKQPRGPPRRWRR
jgi:hypothetical protein